MGKVRMSYKRVISCLLLVVFLGLQMPSSIFAADTVNDSHCIISGRCYKITSKQSKKVMEVSNAGKNNGDLIQQWEDVGVTNQEWIIEEVENGFYKITSLDSKKVIDIKDASSSNGATIHQWDFVNADNQLWYFEKTDDGFYQIKSKKNNKCLDIKGIVSTNGAKIQLWDDVNGDNQKWSIEEIVKKEAPIIEGASYKISNKNSKKSMEVAGSVTNNGGQVQQWDYLEGKNQEWTFEKVDNTYYKIIVNHTGKVLDVKDANKNNGAYIHQWDYVGADNQLWYIEVCDDGYCQIKSKQSNKCLDIYGITTNNGARLQLWDDVNGDNQKWSIEIVHGEEDNDKDGLVNLLEWCNGFNANKADTDEDGLTDYNELYITRTNPLKVDSDGNGVLDGEEDNDKDGLKNIFEIKYNGNPFNVDTDKDGLTDSDEVKYGTKLDVVDTDKDGLSDFREVELGTNPLNSDSNGNGILDGDEEYSFTKGVSGADIDENLVPTIDINLKGEQIDTLNIKKVSGDDFYLSKNIPGYVGCGYEFKVDGEFSKAKLTFKIKKELMDNSSFTPAIYWVDDENQEMNLLENQVIDKDNSTISAELSHFSKYIVLNKQDFDKAWEVKIKGVQDTTKPIDVAFVLDSSGSMGLSDPLGIRKSTAITFVNKLRDIDKGAVVDFQGYSRVLSPFTSDKNQLINAINKVYNGDGTAIYTGIGSALPLYKDQDSTREASKYMIVLSDGQDNYSYNYSSIISTALQNEIEIYTIGLGSSVDTSVLTSIANGTGGKYYNASHATELVSLFDELMSEVVDISKDSDGDGISDYHERNMRFFNGVTCYGQLDPYNADTDGEGISDGDEIGEFVYTNDGKEIAYAKIKSHPLLKDSDGDGLDDMNDETPLEAHNKGAFKVVEDLNYIPPNKNVDEARSNSELEYNSRTNLSVKEIEEVRKIYQRAGINVAIGSLAAPNAAKALEHFLSNCGDDYEIDAGNVVVNTKTGYKNYTRNVDKLIKNAEMMIKDNQTLVISSVDPFMTVEFGECVDSIPYGFDMSLMLGKSSGGMVAEVSRDGDNYKMTLDYYIQDYYDWDKDGGADGFFVNDGEMYTLHEVGWAKQFGMQGKFTTEVSWTKGENCKEYIDSITLLKYGVR